MDQLPDLQSDADVDALMARLRAKLVAPPPPGPIAAASSSERSGNALRDFLVVQEEYSTAMCHALEVIAAALEEFQDEAKPTSARRTRAGSVPPRRSKSRRRTAR
jgi:hypothetical protein